MEKKLSFNEVLPMEELAPVELDAIVGGNAIKIVGTNGRLLLSTIHSLC